MLCMQMVSGHALTRSPPWSSTAARSAFSFILPTHASSGLRFQPMHLTQMSWTPPQTAIGMSRGPRLAVVCAWLAARHMQSLGSRIVVLDRPPVPRLLLRPACVMTSRMLVAALSICACRRSRPPSSMLTTKRCLTCLATIQQPRTSVTSTAAACTRPTPLVAASST